jgi:hypothetical protein
MENVKALMEPIYNIMWFNERFRLWESTVIESLNYELVKAMYDQWIAIDTKGEHYRLVKIERTIMEEV